MKQYRSVNFVLIALLVIATGFYVYLLSNSSVKNSSETTLTQDPESAENRLATIPPSADPIFQQVKEFIDEKTQPDNVLITKKSYVWWLDSDGYNIINNRDLGIESQFNCMNYPASRFDSSLISLSALFPTFMQQQGFTKNNRNSSASLTDDQFYDYVQAYEKDGVKCILTANPDCSGITDDNMWQTISFSCTSNYDENHAIQVPILKDLDIKDAVVSISKQAGNFAKIQVHYRRTGHYMIAVKENGIWKELYRGQDTPSCSLMNQYKVPKEVYESCF